MLSRRGYPALGAQLRTHPEVRRLERGGGLLRLLRLLRRVRRLLRLSLLRLEPGGAQRGRGLLLESGLAQLRRHRLSTERLL